MVDTNILVYYWIPGDFSEIVEKVYLEDREWITSPLWRYEFRNTLAGYLRKKLIAPEDAIQLIGEAEKKMEDREVGVTAAQVVKLIGRSKCSGYDCEFVALAENLALPLVTTDKQILSEFPAIAETPETFLKKRQSP
ncbi:MAG: type II toxin-antitoxin system VapC family toxin [Spirochaetia bacterium]|nr:type II toxin-antitoxin system VapC family toxin [Spirochaetia bacterium]